MRSSNCSSTQNLQLSRCCTRILRIHASNRVGLGLIRNKIIFLFSCDLIQKSKQIYRRETLADRLKLERETENMCF